MNRLSTFAAIAALCALPTPLLAQNGDTPPPPGAGTTERINQIIVYGDDPCPAATGDEIVVCGRMSEDERFRIPEPLRGNPNDPRRESWTARVQAVERTGRFGTDSCTPTGLGGFTGCVSQVIDNAVAERDQAAGTSWTTAVAAERRRRMEGFDAEADAVEAQVLADEAARIAREREAEEAAEVDSTPLPMPQSSERPPQ